jgi:hypothetical protein
MNWSKSLKRFDFNNEPPFDDEIRAAARSEFFVNSKAAVDRLSR